MDNKYKLNNNNKGFVTIIRIILIALLILLEGIIIAQYVTLYMVNENPVLLSLVIGYSAMLIIFESVDTFIIKSFAGKMAFYGLDSVTLLFLCLFTGNSYLSTLYCLVLTQFYISVDDLKKNVILFGISSGLFLISFVGGWFMVNREVEGYRSTIEIISGALYGVFILAVHGTITNFLLRFYSNNAQLKHALIEADESKAQLKDVYEQLSQTAVYEERNRIAKDIHDNAGHSMTTVIMQTEAAKLLIDTNPDEAKNRLISANIQAKNALNQMRESVHLLAGRSQNKTLTEEIGGIIAQTIDGTELKIRTDLQEVTVDEESGRFILNSIKECISNGIRHGKASAFYIEMKSSSEQVNLLISDNGTGVEGEMSEGFGLKGMREKAEALGGRCNFSGEAGEGFEVEITLPINKK